MMLAQAGSKMYQVYQLGNVVNSRFSILSITDMKTRRM